jgi:hypothetical protein
MRIALRNTALLLLILIVGALAGTSHAANATARPSFAGKWEGTLEANGFKLRIVFNIKAADKGAFEGTLDSPDQNAFGLKLDTVKQDGNHVVADIRMLDGTFAGDLSADGASIPGKWTQAGMSLPLTLQRAK